MDGGRHFVGAGRIFIGYSVDSLIVLHPDLTGPRAGKGSGLFEFATYRTIPHPPPAPPLCVRVWDSSRDSRMTYKRASLPADAVDYIWVCNHVVDPESLPNCQINRGGYTVLCTGAPLPVTPFLPCPPGCRGRC